MRSGNVPYAGYDFSNLNICCMKRNLRLFFLWLLFSPLYIKEAQSVGLTKWKRNLLFICSPFILICIGLVLGTVIPVAFFGGLLLVALTEKDEPLPYDSVRFKTRDSKCHWT